jgi:hypothetical protein
MPFDAAVHFKKLCDHAFADVDPQNTGSITKIGGFLSNQLKRRMIPDRKEPSPQPSSLKVMMGDKQIVAARSPVTAKETAGSVLSWGLGLVPVVGGVLALLARSAMDAFATKQLKEKITDEAKAGRDTLALKGQLLLESTAQRYVDAIRKYDATVADYREAYEQQNWQRAKSFRNCSELASYLQAVYYCKVRLRRLRYYHDQVFAYCRKVEEHLQECEKTFEDFERQMQAEGVNLFADARRHFNCDDKCFWPEEFTGELEAARFLNQRRPSISPELIRRPSFSK